jgi:hypothetical protein
MRLAGGEASFARPRLVDLQSFGDAGTVRDAPVRVCKQEAGPQIAADAPERLVKLTNRLPAA